MAEEKNEELPDGEQVAEAVEPSKDKKGKKEPKPKKEGGPPIVLIAGGALGGIILIVLSVVIGTIVANKLFPPYLEGFETAVKEAIENMELPAPVIQGTGTRNLEPFPDDDELEGSNLFAAGANWFTLNSGKITTNVRGSNSMFVSVIVAVDYSLHHKEELVARGFAVAETADKNAEPTYNVDENSTLYQRFKIAVGSKINDFIGSHSEGELQAMRHELGEKLREDLRPTFRDFGLVIGRVNVTQFLIARQ